MVITKRAGFERLQLGGGVLLSGVNMDNADNADGLRELIRTARADGLVLGLSAGETVFSAVPVIGRYRAGARAGAERRVIERWDIRLEVALTEFRADVFSAVLGMGGVSYVGDGGGTLTVEKSTQTSFDKGLKTPFDSVVWAGELADGGMAAVELKNACITGGVRFTAGGPDGGKLTAVFEPAEGGLFDPHEPPYKVYIFPGKAVGD